jgi:hypothetical protein
VPPRHVSTQSRTAAQAHVEKEGVAADGTAEVIQPSELKVRSRDEVQRPDTELGAIEARSPGELAADAARALAGR